MIDISEGQFEHFQHELVSLGDKIAFFSFKSAEACCIHLGQSVDVVGSSKFGINLHDQLSLPLQLFSITKL